MTRGDTLTPAEDRRERACRARGCPCPHTDCRDGWLDDSGHLDAAYRCPRCWAAVGPYR